MPHKANSGNAPCHTRGHSSRSRSDRSQTLKNEHSHRLKHQFEGLQNVLRNRDHQKNGQRHRQGHDADHRVQLEEDHPSDHRAQEEGQQDQEEDHQHQEEDHQDQEGALQYQEGAQQGPAEDRGEDLIARARQLAPLPPCRALRSRTAGKGRVVLLSWSYLPPVERSSVHELTSDCPAHCSP
jgi:hypothetical protein